MDPSKAPYDTVEVFYPYKIRGADQSAPTNNTGLLWSPPQSKTPNVGLPTTASVDTRHGGIRVPMFSLHNRSGGVAAVGIGVRIPPYLWEAGQWVDATTTYTDDTTDAQDVGTDDFAMETTTNNDGFVILSRVPFNAISIDVGVASAGGAAVRAVRYNKGDTWANMSNLFAHDGATGDFTVDTEAVIVWDAPVDWSVSLTDGGLGTGIRQGFYAVNVRATTAPSGTAGAADSLSIYRLYALTEALADNGVYEGSLTGELRPTVEGDALVAFFSVSNFGNRVLCQVRSGG